MEPITREEFYLNKLTGEEQDTPEPVTREEQYLARLCGADNIIPQTPETRREAYLAALCGEEVETPEPVTRIEQYMNFAAGKSQTKPEKPITREEMYWNDYKGGAVPEEKTVQGDIIHITDATGDNAVALSVALTPTQDGTPWISDKLNTEPYLSRVAQNGNTADETIVGGTVVWNQLYDLENPDIMDSNFVTYDSTNHRYTITYPQGSTSSSSVLRVGYAKVIGHKYLAKTKMVPISETINIRAYFPWRSTVQNLTSPIPEYMIFAPDSAAYESIAFGKGSSAKIAQSYSVDLQITDLTLMFSNAPAIADYIYSLEEATTGAGVAWLKSHGFIDDNYHAYNPGELISAKPTAKTVGETTYTLGGADLRGLFKLDANNNLYCDGDVYTSDGTITRNYEYRAYESGDESLTDAITDGTHTVAKLTTPTTEQSTAFTNPQKAGEAEAFVDSRTEKVPVGHSTRYSAEYDINGFEGVTVHVSEAQTGGTTYPVTFTSQGTVYGGTVDVVSGEMSITYAIADMGDLEWTQPSTGYFEAYFNAYNTGHEIFGLLTTSYPRDDGTNMIYYARITARGTNQRGIVVRDIRYNDVTVFKTAVTGQKVAYELSTPITATIDPTTIELNEGENYVWTEEGTTTLTYMARAAQRVLAMNKTLQKNLKSIELKKGGDVK